MLTILGTMRFRRKKDGDTVPKYVIPTVKGHGWYKVTGDRTSRSTRSVTGGGHAGAPATLIEDDTPKRVGEQEQSWPENPNPRYRPTRSIVRPHRPGSLNLTQSPPYSVPPPLRTQAPRARSPPPPSPSEHDHLHVEHKPKPKAFGGAFDDPERDERRKKQWKGPKHSPSGNHYKGMPC